jgi:hypothetical protein
MMPFVLLPRPLPLSASPLLPSHHTPTHCTLPPSPSTPLPSLPPSSPLPSPRLTPSPPLPPLPLHPLTCLS